MTTAFFRVTPRGPFSLADERRFFGDWLSLPSDPEAVAMAFPVEGWQGSAGVVVRQASDGTIEGAVATTAGAAPEVAWSQALATLSLDVDGDGFPDVGTRDPVIGGLQARYAWLRPVCFHSPYEAAVNFVVGQRISMRQARAVRARMARELGDPVELEDGIASADRPRKGAHEGAPEVAREGAHKVAGGVARDAVHDGAQNVAHAFPRPERLATLTSFPGLPDEKVARLRGIARAAADGGLDRDRLRAMPVADALAELRLLRGVGPFAAQGILHRGAGLVDAVTDDEVTKEAVMLAYGLSSLPSQADVLSIAEAWKPYRTWAAVLLHVWLRRERGGPTRSR